MATFTAQLKVHCVCSDVNGGPVDAVVVRAHGHNEALAIVGVGVGRDDVAASLLCRLGDEGAAPMGHAVLRLRANVLEPRAAAVALVGATGGVVKILDPVPGVAVIAEPSTAGGAGASPDTRTRKCAKECINIVVVHSVQLSVNTGSLKPSC